MQTIPMDDEKIKAFEERQEILKEITPIFEQTTVYNVLYICTLLITEIILDQENQDKALEDVINFLKDMHKECKKQMKEQG